MTSIPDTLEPFMHELNKYYEFKDIKYKSQKNLIVLMKILMEFYCAQYNS